MKAARGLYTGVWVCSGVWIPNRGYKQVFGYAQAFWIHNWGYIKVFGLPTWAAQVCLDPQPWLHKGVWIPNRGYTKAFGCPNKLPASYQLVEAMSFVHS